MKFYPLKTISVFLKYCLLFGFFHILNAKGIDAPASPLTSDDVGIEMIGGIIVKTSADFFEQARNAKNVLLIKTDGSLKSLQVKQSFQSSYKNKPHVFTIVEIYNKYHMKVSYEENKEENKIEKFIEVVRVGFANKKAQIPKNTITPKETAPQPPSSYAEDGFERNFDGTSGNVQMTPEYKQKIKSNLSSILMEAAATPVMEGQAIIGFKLEEIDKGSMFEKAGFIDGDTVTSINGRPLNSAASAIKTLNSLKDNDASEITFAFIRGEQTYEVSVKVE